MVVFVMIDGMRPDAIDAAKCVNLQAFMRRGSSTMRAQSVMPSVTLPCHTSIFHSVPPGRHGITTNYFVPMARPVPGLVEVARMHGDAVVPQRAEAFAPIAAEADPERHAPSPCSVGT